jgi:hypothetical protein
MQFQESNNSDDFYKTFFCKSLMENVILSSFFSHLYYVFGILYRQLDYLIIQIIQHAKYE